MMDLMKIWSDCLIIITVCDKLIFNLLVELKSRVEGKENTLMTFCQDFY